MNECNKHIQNFDLVNNKLLRYKPAGRGLNSKWCHWDISSD